MNLLAGLRSRGLRTHELVELPTRPSVAQFRRAMHAILSSPSTKPVQLIVALDEIESLVGPAASEDYVRPDVVEFLGALRALVQENANFTVLLSGMTSSITQRGQLFGRENPFFSWATTSYLPPLTLNETSDLLIKLGDRMAVSWEAPAVQRLFQVSDGHVFLIRNFAGYLVQSIFDVKDSRTVQSRDVAASERGWRRTVSGNVREMLESVGRYYPAEAEALEFVRSRVVSADELDAEQPEMANQLLQLGLLVEEAGTLRLSALATFDRRE